MQANDNDTGVTGLNHPCGKCAFYKQSIWNPIHRGGVSVLNRGFRRREFDVGDAVFEQGDDNAGVYCVSRGLIAIRSLHSDGSSTLIRLAYPGAIIGFRSFLGQRPHHSEARALLPSRICTVAKPIADRLVGDHYEVLSRLAQRCVSEIDRGHEQIIAATTMPSKDRLADLLFRLSAIYGEQRGDRVELRLPMSRPDLADLIGVRPETISRLIKKLEAEGIAVSGRRVSLPAERSERRQRGVSF